MSSKSIPIMVHIADLDEVKAALRELAEQRDAARAYADRIEACAESWRQAWREKQADADRLAEHLRATHADLHGNSFAHRGVVTWGCPEGCEAREALRQHEGERDAARADADRLAEALRYEASVNGITSHSLKALRQHDAEKEAERE